MKYTPGTPTTGNFNVTTPQPLDIKHYFEDNADLIDVVGNDPLSYYEGMIVQDVDTGQKYRWIESAVGEIPGGYTYGIYTFDGVVYTGRTFNWIPFGSQLVLFEVGDTFPPLENYGQGTVAIRPYVVGPDTFTGVYEKTDNVAPGTWNELMTFTSVVDDAYIEAIVIAMFAGTGAADTIARSDHNHTGVYSPVGHNHDADYMDIATRGYLLDRALNSGDTLDDYYDFGLYQVQDGSDVPTEFPSTTKIGYAYGATHSFVVLVTAFDTPSLTGTIAKQEVMDRTGMLCYRYYYLAPAPTWSAWYRYEATDAEMLLDTVINKNVTPASLKAHTAWVSVPLSANWGGTIYVRILTSGHVEIHGNPQDANDDAPSNIVATLDPEYRPSTNIRLSGTYKRGGEAILGCWIDISSATGEITLTGISVAGAVGHDGYFNFYNIYSKY